MSSISAATVRNRSVPPLSSSGRTQNKLFSVPRSLAGVPRRCRCRHSCADSRQRRTLVFASKRRTVREISLTIVAILHWLTHSSRGDVMRMRGGGNNYGDDGDERTVGFAGSQRETDGVVVWVMVIVFV